MADAQGPKMYCYHNEIAPLRVVKHNGPNQGKKFYGCAHWPTLRKEVQELKVENAKLDDMVAELSIENTETRLFMEN
ncbi:Protein ZGRF1 [Bienertia sinuspersici]